MFSKSPIPSFHSDTAVNVHKAVLGAFKTPGTILYNVVCQFPAKGLDSNFDELYPFKGHGQSSKETLDELVEWWQAPWVGSESMPDFNHGSRINGVDSDWQQVPFIVDLLDKNRYTTKAHIVLQHPRPGYAKSHGHPAMCEVFISIRKQLGELDVLDITAVFRKQEMRYWWIVNVREVAAIQKAVVGGLKKKNVDVQAGMITTFTSQAVVNKENVPPLVAVHALDRVVRVRQNVIPRMCADLVKPKASPGDRERWHSYLEDLKPSADRDLDGFPVCVAGLKALASSVELVANTRPPHKLALSKSSYTNDPRVHSLNQLSKIINELVKKNEGMVSKLRRGGKKEVSDEEYNEWREVCESLINKAKSQVDTMIES